MQLKPYKIKIRTGGIMVAILDEDTAHAMDLHVGDRVLLKSDRSKVVALLDIADHNHRHKSIGLFTETWETLNIEPSDVVEIKAADKPHSLLAIRDKLDGKRLSFSELNEIVHDIVKGVLAPVEMTYFVSGCYARGLNDEEAANLTRAIVQNGKTLKFKSKIVGDKHCIGGVPGNRVTPIVIPIVAAAGIMMPKTSSRAITSPAGTADAIETVANVTINAHRLKEIGNKVGAFMVWGGGVDLAAADDKLIKIRNPMSLDPEGMLLASIMAKKHSVGANHVLIDIPIGKTAKIKNHKDAVHLKKRFLTIAKMLGMKMAVIITDGSQPIGNGIGPLLEMIDVMKVLRHDKDAPQDLHNKAIMESGILLELTGKAKKGKGKKMAQELVESGKAWRKFEQIITAQGKKRVPKLAKFRADMVAAVAGKIVEINNKQIAHIARIAGAPKDIAAGLLLLKHVGDTVKKGQPVYTIYASSQDRLNYALEFANHEKNGYRIK